MTHDWLEKKLAQGPIVLPGSPFWEVFKIFGRDELIALGVNVIGTVGVSRLANNPLVLSVAGPLVEKIGFFVAYLKEAAQVYKTTPENQRKGINTYLSTALKRGSLSLSKDILVHDPIYTLLMYVGLKTYSESPVWMLSTLSFLVALGAVTVGEVGLNEARYYNQLLKYKKLGFGLQSFFEARFLINREDAAGILSDVSSKFNLWKKEKAEYQDRYFETKLKSYNQRKVMFRLRQRHRGNKEYVQTAQIVNTITSQVSKNKPEQFNFFPTKKDKLWFHLNQKMPWKIDDIEDEKIRKLCKQITEDLSHDIHFVRDVVRNPESVLVSVDRVSSKESGKFTVIEVKSFSDEKSKALLVEVMRHIMLNYPVTQTTHSKKLLAFSDESRAI